MSEHETDDVHKEDIRSRSEQMLSQAAAAANFQEPHKRYTVMGIIHDRIRFVWVENSEFLGNGRLFRFPVHCSDEDIFRKAYGDPTGAHYWEAWMFDTNLRAVSAMFAAHTARSEDEYSRYRREADDALTAFMAGMVETSGLPRNVMMMKAVDELKSNPNTSHLIPASLALYVFRLLPLVENRITLRSVKSHDAAARRADTANVADASIGSIIDSKLVRPANRTGAIVEIAFRQWLQERGTVTPPTIREGDQWAKSRSFPRLEVRKLVAGESGRGPGRPQKESAP